MPAAAEERLARVRADVARARHPLVGRGLVGRCRSTVGDQVGRIIGAPPGTTVMHQNVTVAEAIVLSCFRPRRSARNRIVYEEANFPSVRYLYQAQPELEVVAVEDDRAIVDAIDERTLLVPISHVLFKNAEIQDVEPIVRARARGGRVRRARLLPVGRRRRRSTSTELGVDFAVGGSVKWLCGGPGRRLALRAARPRRAARADVRRLAGPRAPVRVRAGARVRGRRARASSRARRTCRRSTRRRPATT